MNAAAWSSAFAISFGEMRIDALIWACYNTFLEKGKKVNKTHRFYFFVTVATDFWPSSDGFILWVPRLCSSRVVKKTNLQCQTLYGCIPILSIPCKSPAISPTHVTSSKSPPAAAATSCQYTAHFTESSWTIRGQPLHGKFVPLYFKRNVFSFLFFYPQPRENGTSFLQHLCA